MAGQPESIFCFKTGSSRTKDGVAPCRRAETRRDPGTGPGPVAGLSLLPTSIILTVLSVTAFMTSGHALRAQAACMRRLTCAARWANRRRRLTRRVLAGLEHHLSRAGQRLRGKADGHIARQALFNAAVGHRLDEQIRKRGAASLPCQAGIDQTTPQQVRHADQVKQLAVVSP